MSESNQQCVACVYDSHIPNISFNTEGLCNYCVQHEQMKTEYPTGGEGEAYLAKHVAQMKKDGKGKPYDVVIGVSGGCDSSYMVHLAVKKYGLRVLAAHFDNTFNSKTAVENIACVMNKLNVDLYTHVVDNNEFQGIYKTFVKADVPELDTPVDLAFAAVHYQAAAKYNCKWIWEGHSFRTEGISPPGWFYMDAQYINTINDKFGGPKIKTLPMLSLHKWLYWMLVKRIRKFRPLYYMDYDKEGVKKLLAEEYGWTWYGGHHMENRTSYFVNNYYLPRKFGIDLRFSELSAHVRSGTMTRDEALVGLKEEKPFDQGILEEIQQRVGFTPEEWEDVMKAQPLHYTHYKTYKETFEKFRLFFLLLYKTGYVTKSFYEKFCVLKQKKQHFKKVYKVD